LASQHVRFGPTADGRQLPAEAALLLLFEGFGDQGRRRLSDDRPLAAFAGKTEDEE